MDKIREYSSIAWLALIGRSGIVKCVWGWTILIVMALVISFICLPTQTFMWVLLGYLCIANIAGVTLYATRSRWS